MSLEMLEMSLYDEIYKRKPSQKFSLNTLDPIIIEQIKDQIQTLPQLNCSNDTQLHFINNGTKITDKLSSFGQVKAPYYILVTGTREDSCLISAGYTTEYLVLYLTSLGIATSYIGRFLDRNTATRILGSKLISDVFSIVAFGPSLDAHELYRSPDDLKRLPLESLILGGDPTPDQRSILEAVRIAPSFLNSQTWRFEVGKDSISLYQEKSPQFGNTLSIETCHFDMGIALAHMEIAAQHLGYDTKIYFKEHLWGEPDYIQTIQLHSKNKEDS